MDIRQKALKLYVYVDGVNDVPFYGSDVGEYEEFIVLHGEQFTTSDGFVFNVRNVNEQIEISSFRYNATRMGGAPSITFTLMYNVCLDNFWSENVYATFNGEKFFLKQTPTSSLSNEDARYKHDVALVSERVILDNVYVVDAVLDDASEDRPVSNSTKFSFFGDIREFADRLNKTLLYANLQTIDENNEVHGWNVIVDDDITSDEKLVSFEDAFFSNAIQESYNTYEVPYYFVGQDIHFGNSNSVIDDVFTYGVDNALLSITKNNANTKVVNRATGVGSSDNIPFYYPNNSPKGEIEATLSTSSSDFSIEVIDMEKYSNEVEIGDVVTRTTSDFEIMGYTYNGQTYDASSPIPILEYSTNGHINEFYIDIDIDSGNGGIAFIEVNFEDIEIRSSQGVHPSSDYKIKLEGETGHFDAYGNWIVHISAIKKVGLDNGSETLGFRVIQGYECRLRVRMEAYISTHYSIASNVSLIAIESSGWELNGKEINLSDIGIVSSGIATLGDTITQTLAGYIKTSENLMPSIYRESNGTERFYNALNDTYIIPYSDPEETYEFENPYIEGKPKEHIVKMEDIKPTIEKAVNASNLRIDMFSEFAYDEDDNDETYEDEDNTNFKHPYFYGKLRVLDFNLFDHAIENQPMTISFTSGSCGACNFEIGVTDGYPQRNPVQIYEEDTTTIDSVFHEAGSLKRDSEGRVLAGVEGTQQQVSEYQESQQDTSKYEVWIALKKEEDTYGILMPKAPKYEMNEQTGQEELVEAGHRPKPCTKNEDGTYEDDGDTFVITGINLPKIYITNAEKRLEEEIIKYIKDNNVEKFKFSIKFSRIYFEENSEILQQLDENSTIKISYDGKEYTLYVSSFSYYMEESGVLPDVTIELDDTLQVSQNALQTAISEVRSEMGEAIRSIDVVALANPFYIRKDIDDDATGKINFKKGIKFGEGGEVEILDNNSTKLTIEYLEVTKKASFTSLEIQEKTHVGGQIIISPAAMTCGEVEELDSVYRCYFQTKGENGDDEIFNQFTVNDLAISQTYNAWGSRYYWRKVVQVGEDYIDLSKEICEEGSAIPMVGDKIVQLGNTNDTTRQAAQVLSAYGDEAPSIIMYNGINDFSLNGKNITGIIWNPETQEPQMYSYGSFFFGDRNLDGNFITFQQREGEENKSLTINATVNLSSDSTGLSNLSEWEELEAKVDDKADASDFEYLRETFGAPSADVDGVIMSKMAAVKDNDNNVVAFLNGSFLGANSEHGKLLIAAGISDIETPENAETRVYEDGTIVSNKIKLEEGCEIGNLHVEADGIYSQQGCGSVVGQAYYSASYRATNARLQRLLYTGLQCAITAETNISASGVEVTGNTAYQGVRNAFGVSQCPIGMLVNPNVKVGFAFGDSEDYDSFANGTFAICAATGMFGGLRPTVKVISTAGSYPLSIFDHTVVIDYSSATGSQVTLVLPEASELSTGQVYEIYNVDVDHDIAIASRDVPVYNMSTGVASTTTNFTAAHRRYIKLVYTGTRWIMIFHYLEE